MSHRDRDAANALKSQNIEVAGGAVGAPPTSGGQLYRVGLNASGRFTTVDQFSRLILKTTPDGGHVPLSDVGRPELGAEDYTGGAQWKGSAGIGFGVIQAQNANALDTATNVRATLDELSKTFPPGVSFVIPFDATLFVRESIKEVVQTLAIAVLLVVLVIYAFIQNWRMTLGPKLKGMPLKEVQRLSGLSRAALQAIHSGRRPHAKNRALLTRVAKVHGS